MTYNRPRLANYVRGSPPGATHPDMAQLNASKLNMPYRNLGGTGLMVSALSFGTMTLKVRAPFDSAFSRHDIVPSCAPAPAALS